MTTELPEGWSMTTVDSVGQVDLGRQRSPKWHHGPNMRPYLRVANVFENRIDLTDVKEMDFPPEHLDRYELEPGDILLNEGQSPELVGRPAMYRGELPGVCFTNSLIRFRAGPAVLREFALWYFIHCLKSGRFRQEARITTNIAHLAAGRFKVVEFPLPPLAEQERIVAAIEERFTRLDAAERSLERAQVNLEKLRSEVLEGAGLGDWPTRPLVELTPPDRPICYGILMPKENVVDGVPYVRVRDFPEGVILVDRLHRTALDIANKYKRSMLREKDVLVSIRGTYGRVTIVPAELAGANITQDTARVTCVEDVLPEFMASFLRGATAQRYFRRVARGVAVKGVNIGDLRLLEVPVPPLVDQHRIVEEIEHRLSLLRGVDESASSAGRRATQLRRSILEKAFSGRLVPQDPEDEPASVLLDRIREEERAAAPTGRKRRRAS